MSMPAPSPVWERWAAWARVARLGRRGGGGSQTTGRRLSIRRYPPRVTALSFADSTGGPSTPLGTVSAVAPPALRLASASRVDQADDRLKG
jgi:hypothetical protein